MTTQDSRPQIIITETDESPYLATKALFPLVAPFFTRAGIDFVPADISLGGRILAAFSDILPTDKQAHDDLAVLAALVKTPAANVIKTPNISATEGQLVAAIRELQAQGYPVPDYPENPQTDAEKALHKKYKAITGSAVNPVLRGGDAIRYVPESVKNAARRKPHAVTDWSASSRTRVAFMESGDFYATEESFVVEAALAGQAVIEFVDDSGAVSVLKDKVALIEGQVVDTSLLDRAALRDFLAATIKSAREEDLLLSLHLKATMMINTDGVIFGDVVTACFGDVFEKHAGILAALGFNPANGLSAIDAGVKKLKDKNLYTTEAESQIAALNADIAARFAELPVAMVDPAKGESHLHAPNKVIVDVSMAKLDLWGGTQAARDGTWRDTIALIPDSTYARMHQTVIDEMKAHGALDPKVIGTVYTARLQTNGAEEYGSKDTTFTAQGAGMIRVVAANGTVLHARSVRAGDIFRLCRTEDAGIANWVKIGLKQARDTGTPAVFWLDDKRAHDRALIARVRSLLAVGTDGVETHILSPEDAALFTIARMRAGENSTALTGNVLGDHITDLFPFLEVGTSTKMVSSVFLLSGGLVGETGSAGTAPDLLDSVRSKNHFLFDDLGSFLALAEAAEQVNRLTPHRAALQLAEGLRAATERYVAEDLAPSRTNDLDTRQSQFHFIRFLAAEMAARDAAGYGDLAAALESHKDQILAELAAGRGQAVDLGGAYAPDVAKVEAVMRPSATLNRIFGY